MFEVVTKIEHNKVVGKDYTVFYIKTGLGLVEHSRCLSEDMDKVFEYSQRVRKHAEGLCEA